jgi:hypothetical protein
MRLSSLAVSVVAALALANSGCLKTILMNAQFAAAREASAALNTMGDYETAKAVAVSGVAPIEAMNYLQPGNEDGLFMLTKTWLGVGVFMENDMEAAQDRGDDAQADIARTRARMAYDRSVFYALQLLDLQAQGLETAKKDAKTLDKWLTENFTEKEDAVNLFWASAPWLARIGLMKSDENEGAVLISEAYVGVGMLQRAYALDPTVEDYHAMMAVAGFRAARGPLFGEMEQAKSMFETIIAKTNGKDLMVPLTYAMTYACVKGDGPLYTKLMNEVLKAPDGDPQLRLQNAIAKHRAAVWMGRKRVKDTCGFNPDGPVASK